MTTSEHVTDAARQIVVAFLENNNISQTDLVTLVYNLVRALQGRSSAPSAPTLAYDREATDEGSPEADIDHLEDDVFSSLKSLGSLPNTVEQLPKVDPRDSVRHNTITCLECGKKFQSLKSHLGKTHDLTPQKYIDKWSLPSNYPMVSKAYSSKRSLIMKSVHHRGK